MPPQPPQSNILDDKPSVELMDNLMYHLKGE
jgi:hypothetical protein